MIRFLSLAMVLVFFAAISAGAAAPGLKRKGRYGRPQKAPGRLASDVVGTAGQR